MWNRDDDLDRILEAGRRAPSSRNWQPWDFIVVTDRGQLTKLAKVWQGAGHVAGSATMLGFPPERFAAYLIDFGYPSGRPLKPIKRPDRRPFDEVVHRGRW